MPEDITLERLKKQALQKPEGRAPKSQAQNRIAEILEFKKMTNVELSDLTGISPQHLGLIINNRRKCVSVPIAMKIANALEMKVEDIFFADEEPPHKVSEL